ncbi:MAG: hypothetical protein M1503_03755 [Thaumarchaeota archaeon]|nr:hypothetical protein [Nitrososphaerota archaeon]MCL5317369.1 hypothetical protein [Nitrososphaerota archaeon]
MQLPDGLISQVISGLIGFVAGILSTTITNRLRERSDRKKLAVSLGSEVQAILDAAKDSYKMRKPIIETEEQKLNTWRERKSEILPAIIIADADFSTSTYDKLQDQLGVFDKDIVCNITELYRLVSYSHHTKSENAKAGAELQQLSDSISKTGKLTGYDRDRVTILSGSTIEYAKRHQFLLEKIILLSHKVAKMLDEVQKIDRPKIDAKPNTIHQAEYP